MQPGPKLGQNGALLSKIKMYRKRGGKIILDGGGGEGEVIVLGQNLDPLQVCYAPPVNLEGRRCATAQTDEVAVELPRQVQPLPSQVTRWQNGT